MANFTDFSAILKVYYTKKVIPQLNNKFNVLAKFKKTKSDWSGKNATVPMHTGRNSGRGNHTDGGGLATPGSQGRVEAILNAKGSDVSIAISRMAKAAARMGQKNYFLNYMQAEVDPAFDDLALTANQNAIYGGLTKGYINEHKVSTAAGGGTTVAVPAAGTDTWEWSGLPLDGALIDGNPFAGVVSANSDTWVKIRLFAQDASYAEVLPDVGTADESAIFVSNFDPSASTIDLSVVSNTAGLPKFSTLPVQAGFAIAVEVASNTRVSPAANPASVVGFLDATAVQGVKFGSQDSGLSGSRRTFEASPTGVPSDTVMQQTGIYANLSTQSHFGVSRIAGANPTVQSNLLTVATAGGHVRTPLTKASIQRALSAVRKRSSKQPQVAYIAHEDLQTLYALVYSEMRNKGGETVNAGYEGFAYGAVKEWHPDQDVGRSQIILLDFKEDVWKLLQYGDAALVEDARGNTVFPSTTTSNDGMVIEWYYDHICGRPNSQTILTGFSI